MKKSLNSDESHFTNPQGPDEEILGVLQREPFAYFLKEANNQTGLIADKTQPASPASIAAGILKNIMPMVSMPAIIQPFWRRILSPQAGSLSGNSG